MPQPGAVSRLPLQELNQARQVQSNSSWEASALLQLPVYHISSVPHGLQPQDSEPSSGKNESQLGDYLQCGGPGGTAPSTGDLFPEKKEQTLLISSLFYILGVN